jgi:hypothetical protein
VKTYTVDQLNGARGFAGPNNPTLNYTASDVEKYADASRYQQGPLESIVGQTQQTQIHELGNSASFITNISVGKAKNNARTGQNPDNDSGRTFENCVVDKFNGRK